jgi:hypothetical protein
MQSAQDVKVNQQVNYQYGSGVNQVYQDGSGVNQVYQDGSGVNQVYQDGSGVNQTNQVHQDVSESIEFNSTQVPTTNTSSPLPDARYPHLPKPWRNYIRTCDFCPNDECLICSSTSFFKTLNWTDATNFHIPIELILSQPGWHCCDCQGCRQSLQIARENHQIPFEDLNRVFGPDNQATVVRTDGRIQRSWRILAALRLTEDGEMSAIMCGGGAEDHPGQVNRSTLYTQDGPVSQVVPWPNLWKSVPLSTLIGWNPEVKDNAAAILGKWL